MAGPVPPVPGAGNPVNVSCTLMGAFGGQSPAPRELFEGLNALMNVFLNSTAQLACHVPCLGPY